MGVGRRWRGVFDIVTSDFFFLLYPFFTFFLYFPGDSSPVHLIDIFLVPTYSPIQNY
jgi:hypothetical protein